MIDRSKIETQQTKLTNEHLRPPAEVELKSNTKPTSHPTHEHSSQKSRSHTLSAERLPPAPLCRKALPARNLRPAFASRDIWTVLIGVIVAARCAYRGKRVAEICSRSVVLFCVCAVESVAVGAGQLGLWMCRAAMLESLRQGEMIEDGGDKK